MSAPKGNQFWKNRSKHGRDKLFASSDLLWKAACEYFQWCDNNPWLKVEQLKKPVSVEDDFGNVKMETTLDLPTSRPYSLSGLCLYLDCSTSYFRVFKSKLKKKKEDDLDFLTVITRIEETIFTQQFEGATVGAYNANIISRALGLADNQNVKHDGIPETPPAKQVMIFNGKEIEF